MYLIINREIVNKYTQNDHINSLLHQCHCNDLARIALAGICLHQYDAEPAIEIPQRITAVCEDSFSRSYVGESVACLFTPGSICFNCMWNALPSKL